MASGISQDIVSTPSRHLPFSTPQRQVAPAACVQRRPRYTPLTLWHLLSLDAPTVAAVWTLFAAWACGVHLPPDVPLAMFLAVWILYASDRLLDARPIVSRSVRDLLSRTGPSMADPAAPDLMERHYFHHLHRRQFLYWVVAAATLLAVTLGWLPGQMLRLYIGLGALLLVWLGLVHAQALWFSRRRALPKELAVGVFFPAAVFIPTLARSAGPHLELAPLALLFAAVCTLNCVFLHAWEHPKSRISAIQDRTYADRAYADRTYADRACADHAHATTQWAAEHITALTVATGLLSVAVAVALSSLQTARTNLRFAAPHVWAVPVSCALSATFLLLLHRRRVLLPPLVLRALADLALLTPIPVMLLARLSRPIP